jgi:hypothetical protein
MDARLSEFFPTESEAKRDIGPAVNHRVHARIVLSPSTELRITSQRARGGDRPQPARICIRLWRFNSETNSWWPIRSEPGAWVAHADAKAFVDGVQAARAHLERHAHQQPLKPSVDADEATGMQP